MARRLHLLSLPHTQTTSAWGTCAYTQKCVRFGKMMGPLGYEVILYSGEENEAECHEHVPLLSEKERLRWYPPRDPTDADFGGVNWDPNHESWVLFNARAIGEITSRWQPRDLLCLSMGCCHQMVADTLEPRLPQLIACETGVGYYGVSTSYRAFESYAWMHHVLGNWKETNGRWYDAVIPNYFDAADFPPVDRAGIRRSKRKAGGDYLVFIGRVIPRKGPDVAALIAERVGLPLLVAGPGVKESSKGRIVSQEGDFEVRGPVEYVGVLDAQERNEILAGAAALVCPTIYVEPFGGVAPEAMLAGCPAVAPDYGAFVETVEPGLTGYRFHTIQEGAEAVQSAMGLDRQAIRERALSRFSLEAVGPMFDAWFHRLDGLWDGGWAA